MESGSRWSRDRRRLTRLTAWAAFNAVLALVFYLLLLLDDAAAHAAGL